MSQSHWAQSIFTSIKSIRVCLNCLEKASILNHCRKFWSLVKTTICWREFSNHWLLWYQSQPHHLKMFHGMQKRPISLRNSVLQQVSHKRSRIGKQIEMVQRMFYSECQLLIKRSISRHLNPKATSWVKFWLDSMLKTTHKRLTFIQSASKFTAGKIKIIWSRYATLKKLAINISRLLVPECMELTLIHFHSENAHLQFICWSSDWVNRS